MFEITKAATAKLAEFLKDREVPAIRIFLNTKGYGGPSLAWTLDEPRDTDDVFNIDGFKFIIDKDFMKAAEPIKVDFSEFGFQFDCGLEFEDTCSGCHACC
jgi:Fe-S cluster assembly iron-binding protein IscA